MSSRNFPRNLIALLSAVSLPAALALPANCQLPSDPLHKSAFSPRRINETAATLERARRALLETPHLRNQGEGWPDYIRRITVALPGESMETYRKRLEGYLDTLSGAADATAGARQMPVLQAAGEENRALWKRINQDLSALPSRITHLKILLKQAAGGARKDSDALGTDLTRTLQVIIDAQNALRDARP